MDITLQLIGTGLIATLLMTILLWTFKKFSSIESDMIAAIGSFITGEDNERAQKLGISLHFLVGVVFAIFYQVIWSMFPFQQTSELLAVGALVGFAHGLVFSILLVVTVAEHHPLARFKNASLGVAVVHWAAHVVYGGVLGLSASYVQQEYETLTKVAAILYDQGIEVNREGLEAYARTWSEKNKF